MADPTKPRVIIDPPLRDWRVSGVGSGESRGALVGLLDTLGLHDTPFDPTRPVIATGHQAWFWHPGILAKDLAMSAASERLGTQPVHLVVDHIANPAMAIDVPVRRGDAVEVEVLRLGQDDLAVGTGRRAPLEPGALREAVERFESGLDGEPLVDLSVLRNADALIADTDARSLADTITALQLAWMRPMCGDVFVLRTSQLSRLASFEAMVGRMVSDARRCVAEYNKAVARVPKAGVAPLLVERDRVELPLWVIGIDGSLGRVFADLADSTPILTREDSTPIDSVATDGAMHLPLAPKALALTAYMRSTVCDLFIHGTGGGLYEQITERWWRGWAGEKLAPLTVVSADVTLDLEVPVATSAELEKTVWLRHHLPHNVDRFAEDPATLDPALLAEKRAILAGDPADHDSSAKRETGRRLRTINRALADAHTELLTDAAAAVARARQGLANARIANRRDWCFQLYPPEKLAALRQALLGSA
ncbi:MAG: hypothetical protein AAGA29_13620 [Planctomycetota bacterium]